MKFADHILSKLEDLITRGQFVELETDRVEFKPTPSDSQGWKTLYESANAFLNTHGGVLILGVKEEGTGSPRRYVLTEWQDHAEPKLKELRQQTYHRELRELFGKAFNDLDNDTQATLGVVYRRNEFCKTPHVSGKQTAYALWDERNDNSKSIKEFDAFYRKVRRIFNKLEKDGFVQKVDGSSGYVLRRDLPRQRYLSLGGDEL